MNRNDVGFSEQFLQLWEEHSPVRQCWEMLVVFYDALNEAAGVRAAAIEPSSLHELDSEIQAGSRPMEDIYVRWTNLLWSRIILRAQLKVRDSLTLVFHSCNCAMGYGAALASRAIIEHVALLQHFAERVPWQSTGFVEKEAMIQFTNDLQRLAFGSRLDWDQLFADAGALRRLLATESWSRPRNERIPDLGQLIGALDGSLFDSGRLAMKGQIQFVYSVLCDVVHPSWGGDFVYSPRMYRGIESASSFDEHLKLQITLFCLPVVEVVGHLLKLCESLRSQELRAVV